MYDVLPQLNQLVLIKLKFMYFGIWFIKNKVYVLYL
jgi:hypothetical protein